MDIRLSHLDCRLGILGKPAAAERLGRRAAAIVRSHLPGRLEAAITARLADLDGHYVIRHVDHRWHAHLGAGISDEAFAERWSRQIADAVVRSLHAGTDGEQVKRFDSEAEMVARFVQHDLSRPAADPWWFAGLRRDIVSADTDSAGFAALAGDPALAPEVLARLAEAGALAAFLADLDGEQLERLWREVLGGPALADVARAAVTRGFDAPGHHPSEPDAAPSPARPADTASATIPDDSLLSVKAENGPLLTRQGIATTPSQRKAAPLPALPEIVRTPAPPDGAHNPDRRVTVRTPVPPMISPMPALPELTLMPALPELTLMPALPELTLMPALPAAPSAPIEDNVAQAARGPFQAAIEIASRLGWLINGSGTEGADPTEPAGARRDGEALFAAFLARWPGLVDWRDRASLTDAVEASLRFLADHGLIRTDAIDDHTRARLAASGADWLDLDRLAVALTQPAAQPVDTGATSTNRTGSAPGATTGLGLGGKADRPDRAGETTTRPRTLTPRQADILSLLVGLVRNGRVRPEAGRDGLARTAIRLYGELLRVRPGLADDPLPPRLIAAAVEAWATGSAGSQATPKSPLAATLEAALADIANFFEAAAAGTGIGIGPAVAIARDTLAIRPGTWIDTPNAGLFRLFRGIMDLRLHTLAKRLDYPDDAPEHRGDLLHAIALRCAVADADGRDDPALALFGDLAGQRRASDLAERWRRAAPDAHDSLAGAVAELAALQLARDGRRMHLWRLENIPGIPAFAAGAAEPQLALMAGADPAALAKVWAECHGAAPSRVVADREPTRRRLGKLDLAHRDAGRTVTETFLALSNGRLGVAGADAAIAVAAAVTVAGWARWLKGLARSSPAYLLRNMLRLPGRVRVTTNGLEVEVAPGPLDVVIALSGYNAPIEAVPWLGGASISFRRDERTKT